MSQQFVLESKLILRIDSPSHTSSKRLSSHPTWFSEIEFQFIPSKSRTRSSWGWIQIVIEAHNDNNYHALTSSFSIRFFFSLSHLDLLWKNLELLSLLLPHDIWSLPPANLLSTDYFTNSDPKRLLSSNLSALKPSLSSKHPDLLVLL